MSDLAQLIENSRANQAIAHKLFTIETEILSCSSSTALLQTLLKLIKEPFSLTNVHLLLVEPTPISYMLSPGTQTQWQQENTRKISADRLALFHNKDNEYETEKQREAGDERRAEILKWLLSARGKKAPETEDMVFRMRSLELVGAESTDIDAAVEALLATQRDDGGWAQKIDMKSDAYATATALAALLRGGHVDRGSKAAQQAARFLLDAQKDDGSWHVVTRAKGFQTYFESGYPHGKDQFISCAAGGWATIALTLMLPD